MSQTKTEILAIMKELEEAMVECCDASKAEDDAKLRKIKAQKRLSLAKSAVSAITFN